MGKLLLGKLVVGEIAVGDVVTGEIVLGKLRWGNDLTPFYRHLVNVVIINNIRNFKYKSLQNLRVP